MSHTKTVISHALLVVSALLILSQHAAASWPVKIAGGGSAQAIAVDHEGNIIASGDLSGPTLDVYKLSGEDGGIIWSYRYGLQGVASRAIAVDSKGDVIVGNVWGSLIKISGVDGRELWVKLELEEVTGVKTDE
jgi:outer membrane protein assembly factor BamB